MQVHGEASNPPTASALAEGFKHQALIYDSDEEFVDVALPFVAEAIALEEPTLAAVQHRHVENLRAELGSPPGVTILPVDEWYETSAGTREKFHRWVVEHSRGRRVRLIGEPPWAIGNDAQIRDWARHESVLNVAFADHPVTFICPYDARALPEEVVAHARSTHPEIVGPDGIRKSGTYEDPLEFCTRLDAEVRLESGAALVEMTFGVMELPEVRRLARSSALTAGLSEERAEELAFAVNEVATNALVHGLPPTTLRIWRGAGELVFEVSDAGWGISHAFAGQLTPSPDGVGGRGLWMARLLCDAVEVRCDAWCTVALHATVPMVAAAG